jgi:hypothetical protein
MLDRRLGAVSVTKASHRQVPASPAHDDLSATGGFRGPAMCAVVRNLAETYTTGRELCVA